MTKKLALAGSSTLLALLAWSGIAVAGDAKAGRAKAAMCEACHGLNGIGLRPDVPNIGGESDIYLVAQLTHFRSGERQHEQMSIIAEGLSDEDIENLAAWYSSIQFSVTLPP